MMATQLAVTLAVVLALMQTVLVAAVDVTCSEQAPTLPHNTVYMQKCDPSHKSTAPGVWPCFTHSSGSLYGADIASIPGPVDNDLVVAKNADLTDFVPASADKNVPITIRYHDAGISLHYRPKDACYTLSVEKWSATSGYRMQITVQADDLAHTLLDTATIMTADTCEKWIWIRLDKE
ncbi:related to Mig1 protein [Sporisorium reilianum SRZ2]|uniref:Related to Mig1 protein n=1 Tax=Sporisorium reilianum (strain SRZ2) TaxID=999809 RepID=E7A2B3_SPORE|nr:related to Mig1 protein [Sporisorium reilianum SRZ2]